MTRKRPKNLDDTRIKLIVGLLDGWSGDLTWERLIGAIELRLFSRYTRQALYSHEPIRLAFKLRKEECVSVPQTSTVARSAALQVALETIARLEAENRRLETTHSRLLEQFSIWSYNAYTHGLSEDALNRPLPRVDRGQTR